MRVLVIDPDKARAALVAEGLADVLTDDYNFVSENCKRCVMVGASQGSQVSVKA